MQIKTEKPAESSQDTCNTLFTRHIILKIMSFISSRVNYPGSIRKLSLTIIISFWKCSPIIILLARF